MAWDPVPWLIGGDDEGGAEHSPEICRLVTYIGGLGGREGVLEALDLRVLPLATPSNGFRMMPGAFGVNSIWQNRGNYIGRMASETVESAVAAATDSTRGKSHLIVANIMDPFAPGSPWTPPTNRRFGPYIETSLITDVPPTTETMLDLGITDWTSLAVARFDMGPNTSTINANHIKDLRVLANPITGVEPPPEAPDLPSAASKVQTYIRDSGGQQTDTLTYPANVAYKNWPAAASATVAIPSYATKMTYEVHVQNVRVGNSAAGASYKGAYGDLKMVFGSVETGFKKFDFDGAETVHSNEQIFLSGEMNIPASMRGSVIQAYTRARLYNAYHPQSTLLAGDDRTSTKLEFNFRQTPSYA